MCCVIIFKGACEGGNVNGYDVRVEMMMLLLGYGSGSNARGGLLDWDGDVLGSSLIVLGGEMRCFFRVTER